MRSKAWALARDQRYLDFVKTLRLGAVLRNSFAIITVLICILLKTARLLSFPIFPLVTVVLLELSLNQTWPVILRRIKTVEGLKHFSLVSIVCDILATSASIYIVGAMRGMFINLAYFFLILWAGFFISARACYITAFASASAYATVLWIQYLHRFHSLYLSVNVGSLPMWALYLATALGNMAAMILTAYFGAKAAELLASSQKAHETTLELKADLDHTFQQLVRSEKMAATGELAAGMAHEIYNPLTAIAGLAESALMQHKEDTAPRITEALRTIKSQADRAGAVVRRLLGFAKPAEPKLAPCDLNETANEALSMVRYKADIHKITIELKMDPDLPKIIADQHQILEVCINLMLNAVQAMPQGGHLRVVTRKPDAEHVELQITDTGCGIPATHLPRIFDPFFTTKGPTEGTGLGLSVTHSIVQRHCGSIDVRSQVNKGTTFFIRLPMDPTQTVHEDAETPAMVIDLTRSMATPNVMVVDDDPVVCGMLAQFLVDNGYQATTALSGAEAVRLAAKESPDLVLLDMRMPGMDGVECLRKIKEINTQTPVIMVTAMDDETVATYCLELGAVEYLVKPVSLEYLRSVLTVHLRRHPDKPATKDRAS